MNLSILQSTPLQVKTSYRKAVEMISRLLHGESLGEVSGMMDKMVEKYDKFIKDLHLSVIKYAENMYNNVVNMLSSYWKKMLQNIEPTIIRILHYAETTLWNASKDVIGKSWPTLLVLLLHRQ